MISLLLLTMKLPTLPWLMAYAGTALLAFQSLTLPGRADSPPPGETGGQLTGTWRVEVGKETGTIVITPTGQVYVLNQTAEGAATAIEIGRVVQKLSPTATLPPNANVTSLAQQLTQQATKARQAEAKQYIGSMNRAEQAYFLEKNRFTATLDELGLGIQPETQNYRYRLFILQRPRTSKPELNKAVWSIALPKKPELKSYAGVVWIGNTAQNELTSFTVLCESNQPTAQIPSAPTFQEGKNGSEASCPKGFSSLSR